LIVAVPSTVMRWSTPGKVVVVAADQHCPLFGLELAHRRLDGSPGLVAALALVLHREEQAEPLRLSLKADRRHEPLLCLSTLSLCRSPAMAAAQY
jgi:hypothetical protein